MRAIACYTTALAVAFWACPVDAAVTVIDFEDLAAGTTVTTQYGSRGVLFNSAYLDTDSAAHSGTKVLRSANIVNEFNSGPMVITFTDPQSRVRIFASCYYGGQPGVFRAYNAGGALISQDGPKPVPARVFTTVFEVRASSPSIVRVELEIGVADFEAIDDLEFEPGAVSGLPNTPPLVRITSPAEGAELDLDTLPLQGTVTGSGVFPTATARIDAKLPPDSTAPPFTTAIALSGGGSSFTFLAPIGSPPLGPMTITVEARNSANLVGNAVVHATNLPQPIRTRYTADGGASVFGSFAFGGADGACKMAVYERGAISTEGGATHVVRSDILTKWIALRDVGAFIGRLGCPTEETRSLAGGFIAQSFRRGRIYAGPAGTFYAPPVFVEAIDKLGAEAATGFPVADPVTGTGSSGPWLFQQFTRPGTTSLRSTLEITGTPPVLWVERQGGDLADLTALGLTLASSTPTIWQGFSCTGNQGPCAIAAPVATVGSSARYCDGPSYPSTWPFSVSEWDAISGNYVLTPLFGFVQDGHVAGLDLPFTHSYTNDWNIVIRPLPAYRNLLDNTPINPVLFPGQTNQTARGTLELEAELYFLQYFFILTDHWSQAGDLIFTSGRWIVDCGHYPYNLEIHPPSIIALINTQTYQGRPATVADIWVGGFYPGDPVSFDIFPPPKPSPDASLVVVRQDVGGDPMDVTIGSQADPRTHVTVQITASPRRVNVTLLGEMQWEFGRGYSGKWRVYWDR
jgi:hypothetical protein